MQIGSGPAWESQLEASMQVRATGVNRVAATEAALQLIQQLPVMSGPLMFPQLGNCCDGSSPMCFPEQEFKVGGSDVSLGEIGAVRFYMGASQFECRKRAQLMIDVVPGRGEMFSLGGLGGSAF
jgi:uncharacterized protein